MSRRETQLEVSLQQWRGVDQRSSPTLVQDGFFVMSRGVFFGLGENAERVPGKRLSGVCDTSVFNLAQMGSKVFIQTMDTLFIADVTDLTEFELVFQPGVPGLVVLSNLAFNAMDATMPALPLHAVSLSLQRSLDGIVWTTVATGLAGLQIVPQTGLAPLTLYYFRAIAVSGPAQTFGASSNATTTATPSTFNRITEASEARITEAGDNRIIE